METTEDFYCSPNFDSTVTGLLIVNREGRVLQVNPAFMILYETEESLLEGRNIEEYLVREETLHEEALPHLRYFNHTGRPHPGHYSLSFNTGKKGLRTFIVTETTLIHQSRVSSSAPPEAKVMRLIDISERIDKEKLIRERVTLQSRFLANMAHEIRNPLSAITGFAELLLDDKKFSFESREKIMLIRKSSDILMELINDLLDFSKIEANKLQIVHRNFSLPELVKHLEKMFRDKIENKGLYFGVHVSSSLPDIVYGDDLRIGQILTNLLGNATKFTELGAIELSLDYLENSEAIFTVKDSGIGISSEGLLSVFEAFVQSNKEIQKTYGGTGLGLAISLQLAQLMKGDLFAESEPGIGSVFTLRLPLPRGERSTDEGIVRDTEEMSQKIALLSTKKFSILIMEDNEINQKLALHVFRRVLPKSVIDIRSNGYEGLQALSVKHYDIVFTDIHMPVMDGITAARQWKKHPAYYPVPFVVVSAESGEKAKSAMEATQLFAEIMPKPLKKESVTELLYRLESGNLLMQ